MNRPLYKDSLNVIFAGPPSDVVAKYPLTSSIKKRDSSVGSPAAHITDPSFISVRKEVGLPALSTLHASVTSGIDVSPEVSSATAYLSE
jgi:hypothetical protein